MGDLVAQLKALPLGDTLTANEAKALVEKAKVRNVSSGAYLFRADDDGRSLYVVIEGTFQVVLGLADRGGTVVATVGAGQLVGEIELMTRSRRVASLQATDDAVVLELAGDNLDVMLAENHSLATKLVTNIAKTLARRLAAVNHRVVSRPAVGSAPKPAPAPAAAPEPTPVAAEDILPVDEDLDVLDKLWG